VKIIGQDFDVTGTFTPPGASYSLLAWTGGRRQCCRLGITNTSTLATITVRSRGRYGFTYGGLFSSGAFSPDGTRLAVMLNTTNPQDPYRTPYSVLAIVDTRTGAVRLVRAARLVTTEDVGWARWLPGGNQLIVGAEAGSYAVNATRLAARPFSPSSAPPARTSKAAGISTSRRPSCPPRKPRRLVSRTATAR